MATKTDTKTATSKVRNADPKEEAKLKKIDAPFATESEDVKTAAIRYGRKLLRVMDGKRSSMPPAGILTKDQCQMVADALGFKFPEKKTATKPADGKKASAAKGGAAAKAETPADGDDVKSDPKPNSTEAVEKA